MRRNGSVEEKPRKEKRAGAAMALIQSDQRKMAKAGMVESLGALFATGFSGSRGLGYCMPGSVGSFRFFDLVPLSEFFYSSYPGGRTEPSSA
jgi:hypothetical protein